MKQNWPWETENVYYLLAFKTDVFVEIAHPVFKFLSNHLQEHARCCHIENWEFFQLSLFCKSSEFTRSEILEVETRYFRDDILTECFVSRLTENLFSSFWQGFSVGLNWNLIMVNSQNCEVIIDKLLNNVYLVIFNHL